VVKNRRKVIKIGNKNDVLTQNSRTKIVIALGLTEFAEKLVKNRRKVIKIFAPAFSSK
jgi:hypothetical protein